MREIEFPYTKKRKILTTRTVSTTLLRNACPVHMQQQLSEVTERNETPFVKASILHFL